MSLRAGGVRTWVVQRVSALYMGGFVLVVIPLLMLKLPLDYQQWHSMLATPWFNIGFMLFWLALFFHAWIGIRDVILDYVSNFSLRFSLLTAVALALSAMAVWVLKILLLVWR